MFVRRFLLAISEDSVLLSFDCETGARVPQTLELVEISRKNSLRWTLPVRPGEFSLATATAEIRQKNLTKKFLAHEPNSGVTAFAENGQIFISREIFGSEKIGRGFLPFIVVAGIFWASETEICVVSSSGFFGFWQYGEVFEKKLKKILEPVEEILIPEIQNFPVIEIPDENCAPILSYREELKKKRENLTPKIGNFPAPVAPVSVRGRQNFVWATPGGSVAECLSFRN